MPPSNRIYVFFGMIASGKSTLAEAWAARHGFVYHNSDRLRKELAGLSQTAGAAATLDAGIYTSTFSRRTYDALLKLASLDLDHGDTPVLDASYQKAGERDLVRVLAKDKGVGVYFVFCTCSETEVKRRLAIRAQDPSAVSDGNWEIFLSQKARFELPDELRESELLCFDNQGDNESLLQRLDDELAVRSPGFC